MEKARLVKLVLIAAFVCIAFFCWCYAKKSDTVRKWGWRIIGAAAVVFLTFSVWYHIPIYCSDNVQVVDKLTQKAHVIELELFIRRSYFKGTRISGWICTPVDTYGASWVGEATRKNGVYSCNTMFRADTMAPEPSFDNSISGITVAFSRGFDRLTYLDMVEHRENEEWFWYETPAKP